jgi:hypothetical protein
VADRQILVGEAHHHTGELIDRHHFLRADVDWTSKVGAHEAKRTFDAFVDVEEGSRLVPVTPDLDFAAGRWPAPDQPLP